MKLVSLKLEDGTVRSGILEGTTVRLLPRSTGDAAVEFIVAGGDLSLLTAETVPLSAATLLAPVSKPPRIFGIGLNYVEHAAESKMKVQAVPTVFLKLPSSLTGPDTDVLFPPEATQPDYEAELAVVIGKGGYRIKPTDWENHVFGYTIVNDVSARGVQLATTQWTLGKSFATFTPLGPWIVTRDEIPDPHELDITMTVSGEILQSANTRDLIFRIPQLIEYVSSIVALEPGDIISTGTPPGVGLGRTPQRWLLADEEMVIDIQSIGRLRNRTRAIA
jgi:2-keto-4-pentenoate hydratase/2-oxohepta-3-ene-1,7-dioic acid hydratase in catechol pathway